MFRTISLINVAKRSFATKSFFIGNIPFNAKPEDLVKHFSLKDDSSIVLVKNAFGKSKGRAFVRIDETEAKDFIKKYHDSDLLGRKVLVKHPFFEGEDAKYFEEKSKAKETASEKVASDAIKESNQ